MRPRPPPAPVAEAPYRPLYQVGDRATFVTSADGELVPLGILMIVLGLLRILPTVVLGLPGDVELAIAVAMFGVGCLLALGIRRRRLRWRRHAVRR